MCTVSVIFPPAQPGTCRVVSSRDEQRSRPPATPPTWHAINGANAHARAVWPTDTLAGGTWIAAAQHGLVLAILNLNPDPPISLLGVRGLLSRGAVIPALIGQPDTDAAVEGLRKLPLERLAPFRLVAVGQGSASREGHVVLEASWDRAMLSLRVHEGPAVCFTSSGLGDHLVAERLRLFKDRMTNSTISAHAQDAYHDHQWPDNPELSVRMVRRDARTVSVAAVSVTRAGDSRREPCVAMSYRAIEDADSKRASA